MNNQVFVPVTDDLIYNHPEQIEGPLVPYSAGMECSEWLSIEINPEDELPESKQEVKQEIRVLKGRMIRTPIKVHKASSLVMAHSS